MEMSTDEPVELPYISPHTKKMMLELTSSGLAVCTATACTNPIDVVKTRIQLQAAHGPGVGIAGTGIAMLRNEGVMALSKGVVPAMARGLVYGGLRLGLYSPVKDAFGVTQKHDAWNMYKKIGAGMLSGGIAAGITNPTELVKTRLQEVGTAHASSSAVIRHIVATDGVAGLWRGTVPSMTRASLLTASQCASYDVVKRYVIAAAGGKDSVGAQFAAGAVTGLITTTVTSPADVLKTKMFAAASGGAAPAGAGAAATAAKLFREEGAAAFFKGWTANYARLGPQTMITFIAAEQIRHAFGMDSL